MLVNQFAPTVPLRVLNKPFPTYLSDVDPDNSLQGGKYKAACGFRFTGAKLTVTVTQNVYNAEGSVYGGCCRSKQWEPPELTSDDRDLIEAHMSGSRALDVPIFDSQSYDNQASVDLRYIDRYSADKTYEAVWIPGNATAGAWHGSLAPLIAYDTQLLADTPPVVSGHTTSLADTFTPAITCFPVARTRGTITGSPNVPTCQIVITGIPATGCKIKYGITYGVEFVYMANSTAANMMMNAKLANDYLLKFNKYGQMKAAGKLGEVIAEACRVNPALGKHRGALSSSQARLSPPLTQINFENNGRGAL